MSELDVRILLQTPSVTVRDVHCRGSCRHRSGEECTHRTHLVFPYRGTYLRHVGSAQSVAESNQVLMFNAGQGYRVSHPVPGGDASLVLVLDEEMLREISPPSLTQAAGGLTFRRQQLGIDPRTQALAATLRHRLRADNVQPLEAESLALALARRALGTRTAPATSRNAARRRLADRAKLVLAADLSRRWTLADVAAEVGVSPVYLTQVFQQVEGVPMYRYQLRLRLARSLDLLDHCDDLSRLALDLGFSSHSHFSTAFRVAYGRSPARFRQDVRHG